jgi:hypothetical protein
MPCAGALGGGVDASPLDSSVLGAASVLVEDVSGVVDVSVGAGAGGAAGAAVAGNVIGDPTESLTTDAFAKGSAAALFVVVLCTTCVCVSRTTGTRRRTVLRIADVDGDVAGACAPRCGTAGRGRSA